MTCVFAGSFRSPCEEGTELFKTQGTVGRMEMVETGTNRTYTTRFISVLDLCLRCLLWSG